MQWGHRILDVRSELRRVLGGIDLRADDQRTIERRGAASAASSPRMLSTSTPSQPIACASSAMSVGSIRVPQLG